MLYAIPRDSKVVLEQHGFPVLLCAIQFLFHSCQTQARSSALCDQSGRESGDSSAPLQIPSLSLLNARGWRGAAGRNVVPSPLIHYSDASTSPILSSWAGTNGLLRGTVKDRDFTVLKRFIYVIMLRLKKGMQQYQN